MSRLPLHTLPAFRAVARLDNLRAAAEELHLTHSAVSQQIKLLEEQLGFELFDRRGRRIVLNAAGAALLRAVEPALTQLDEGMRAAAAAASGTAHRLRVTVLPSFAQRWLLPRMGQWHELHPDIAMELHASQQVIDLKREGFHAALRQGQGPWRGLEGQCLIDSPSVVLGSPRAAHRLQGGDPTSLPARLADEPLLGNVSRWEAWFALAGVRCRINPVAAFNDAGMMLQAAEQDLGITLSRELLAADALREGRLVRLSPLALPDDAHDSYWLVHPPELRDWPPLQALRTWLVAELERSEQQLQTSTHLGTP
ncbi:LysR substrate-binding domain-containing protein [Roseateles toxinivorans]|uniref:DNA-binding transcriptional LysR family regulator n=1 Tax=Roseateles toxinivorans TaxID=270368 RepID=A0A4R6QKV1_9BURK|nr:LysR substrate-binding domain-containing protein [Roseateles toxinivorans]TDP63967.1 DNA-binding transcriptional LysR family regulator [Roseateles toxinivorans]